MITFFHRNKEAGFSINKVTQTYVHGISPKQEYYVPCRRASLRDILRNMWFVYKRRDKHGINHVTGDIHYCILSLFGCKSVLTIHDTAIVDYNSQSKLQEVYHRWLWYLLPLKFATKVTCISNTTKLHLEKYTKRKDIVVIYNAIDPSFKTVIKDPNQVPYNILIIGTNPNKNLERTILALESVCCKITIIGILNESQRQLLNSLEIEYESKSNLSDDEILQEYINSDIVSFISLFEGFGMPVIEANKTGRPVITSTIPVLKEVAGDSAVFVNPLDVADMHNGFVRLFADAELRRQCVERGLENAKRFEQEAITEQYINIYNSMI